MAADDQISRIEAALKDLHIAGSKTTRHEAVMTSDAHAKVHAQKGVLAKNLFLKDKKKKLSLVTVRADREVDLKKLTKLLGGGGFRFAEADTLQSVLGVAEGCVTPLAAINDKEKQVTYVLDKALAEAKDAVLVHPLTNTATTSISSADLLKFLHKYAGEQNVKIVDLDAVVAGGDEEAAAPAAPKARQQQHEKTAEVKEAQASETVGITAKKEGDFADWYKQVVTKSEMIEYYDISGCYILRPWAYAIWEMIQAYFDKKIKDDGVQNAYFPLFISEAALTKEKDHVEGFAPEVAWVTHAGETPLEQKIAVRPTSETIMYPSYAKWIRSHRDLPLRLNQWSNVVRWEFKYPTPFIRSREFLWQEGHSAFATLPEAESEVLRILDFYRSVYEDLLAVPVTKGKKTEREKFAGGFYTTTAEAFVPITGRGIQGATSHCLGQNFSKMFEIEFQDQGGKWQKVWQNSWGLTTRTIGVMIMLHADDKGLVLPPRVAPYQAVIVPIYFKTEEENKEMNRAAYDLAAKLKAVGIRVHVDDRDQYKPGWKYNHWELRGVPLRLAVGPRDLKEKTVEVARRDNGAKTSFKWDDLAASVSKLLDTVQTEMLEKARQQVAQQTKRISTWAEFMQYLNRKFRVLTPFCDTEACEGQIKERSGRESKDDPSESESGSGPKLTGAAKSLCKPFEWSAEDALKAGEKCFACGQPAKALTFFGRSY